MKLPRLILLVMSGVALGLMPMGRAIAREAADSAKLQVVVKHAPDAKLKQQMDYHVHDGKGVFPAPVEIVLRYPATALEHKTGDHSASDTVVKLSRAPPR